MAKISDEIRNEFSDTIKPYQSKITAILAKERTVLNSIEGGAEDSAYKKIMLCEDMIYVSTLYMAQNSLSLKILDVKNNDALNESRKILYKAIIYLDCKGILLFCIKQTVISISVVRGFTEVSDYTIGCKSAYVTFVFNFEVVII